jgi:hypothetical protein
MRLPLDGLGDIFSDGDLSEFYLYRAKNIPEGMRMVGQGGDGIEQDRQEGLALPQQD